MADTVFVAGSTGQLGRRIIAELLAKQYRVVALVREGGSARLAELAGRIECREADPLRRESVAGLLRGCQVLISCLGASVSPSMTKGRAGYTQVDTPANLNLVQEAQAAGVRKIVYVSVAGAARHGDLLYYRAHEDVVRAIQASGLPSTIIRPTGFFSVFEEFLGMAKQGLVPIFGDGSARSNPIADADLARICVESIADPQPEREVGGPEVLTRRDIVALAFSAVGKPVRTLRVPPWLVLGMATLLRPILPRIGQLLQFVVRISTQDVIGEQAGTLRLADYLRERAGVLGLPREGTTR